MRRRAKLDGRKIKSRRAYTIEELARALGCHKNTIRNLMRDGLRSLADKQRPALIHGSEAKAFLEARQLSSKRKCAPDELYCLKCKEPRRPAANMADIHPSPGGGGMLAALCCECGTRTFKHISAATAAALCTLLDLQIVEEARTIKRAA